MGEPLRAGARVRDRECDERSLLRGKSFHLRFKVLGQKCSRNGERRARGLATPWGALAEFLFVRRVVCGYKNCDSGYARATSQARLNKQRQPPRIFIYTLEGVRGGCGSCE